MGYGSAQVNGQLASITRSAIDEMHIPKGISVIEAAVPLQLGLTYDMRSKVKLIWSAVALVLLIGCVNIAGILLALGYAVARNRDTPGFRRRPREDRSSASGRSVSAGTRRRGCSGSSLAGLRSRG